MREALIDEAFDESDALLRRLRDTQRLAISQAADIFVQALSAGHKLLVFGNGGSATDAQHLCGELVGRFRVSRPALPALALGANVAALTAIANDYSYDDVFEREIEAFGQPGDVALALSTSGRSRNVIRGAEAARRRQLRVVVLTGARPNPLVDLAEIAIRIPSESVARIQEAHLFVGHLWCDLIEQAVVSESLRARPQEPVPNVAPLGHS
jgi:D-sedoheptulose 7-phosphate isomerase